MLQQQFLRRRAKIALEISTPTETVVWRAFRQTKNAFCQFVIRTTMTGSTRQSKRVQPSKSSLEVASPKKAKTLATRVSVGHANNCCDFGTRNDLCCGSCQKHCEIPEKKRKERSDHTSRTHQRHVPCEFGVKCLQMPRHKIELDAWFASQNAHRISSLVSWKRKDGDVDSQCNALNQRFVELDCGDNATPQMAHLERPVEMFEFALLDKTPESAAELVSAAGQLICILKR
jgi:hypothetical protein